VWSRRGALFNDRFPRIAEAMGALPVDNALLDGEAVVFLPDGHSDFAALLTKAGGVQASFVAFDLPSLEGADLRQRPLEERREALAQLVAGADRVRFSEAIDAEGDRVEARRQPPPQRAEPQLAQVSQPGISTPVRDHAHTLAPGPHGIRPA
jgi:bifunctional non-homologous end joining protein LigD